MTARDQPDGREVSYDAKSLDEGFAAVFEVCGFVLRVLIEERISNGTHTRESSIRAIAKLASSTKTLLFEPFSSQLRREPPSMITKAWPTQSRTEGGSKP